MNNVNACTALLLAVVTTVTVCLPSANAALCGTCYCAPGNDSCPTWVPPAYNSSFVHAFSSQTVLNPFSLSCNPYDNSSCVTSPTQEFVNLSTAVCARVYSGGGNCSEYKMQTFSSADAARRTGAVITHERACGLCSTTQDVGVYLSSPNMAKKGKICGIEAAISEKLGIKCFMKLGYTAGCAAIWTYDALFDTKHCGKICVKELFAPDNGPPPFCPINKCLACDETLAGPIFKAFAGATRRRSGILSTITRPCESIAHVTQRVCDVM